MKGKSVLIISFTPIRSEPRVLRQIRSFLELGMRVTVAGYPPQPLENVTYVDLSLFTSPVTSPVTKKVGSRAFMLRVFRRLKVYASRVRLLLNAAMIFFPRKPGIEAYWHNEVYQRMHAFLQTLPPADMIVAHDWFTAPIAEKLAAQWGVSFFIDIHEYARKQNVVQGGLFSTMRHYASWIRPLSAVHKTIYPKAAALSCVCDGIADLVWQEEGLPHRPVTVRSTPPYEEHSFRECGDHIVVLYHGIFAEKRKLDVLIQAIPLCDARFRFVLRGHGEELDALKELAISLDIEERIVFEASVPFKEIIPAANKADIGYIVLDDFSPQHRFVLPNKFFEYIMAGLALVVSDFPEMSKLVRHYDNGKLVAGCSAELVAETLNSLIEKDINAMKRRSLEAAKELCWMREQHAMLTCYGLEPQREIFHE